MTAVANVEKHTCRGKRCEDSGFHCFKDQEKNGVGEQKKYSESGKSYDEKKEILFDGDTKKEEK